MIAFTANAINVTLDIDDPSRVKVQVSYVDKEGLVQGENQLEVNEWGSVKIMATDGNFISSVIRKSDGTSEYVSNMTSCTLYMTSSNEGETWTVTSQSADEARDGYCKIWVDDASKVRVQRSTTYTDVENLVSGDWADVKYIKTSELPLTIASPDYGTPLYKVVRNGAVVEAQGSSYSISPEDGDEIEIFANFPDEDVAVKFVYETEDAKGFITKVQVDEEDVSNYNDEDFTVKLGSKINISGDKQNYNLITFKVNDTNVSYFYGSYSFTVTEATTIYVDAHKYGTLKATLNVDNPENIIVYRGAIWQDDIITGLTEGDNSIEVSETVGFIQIGAQSGCFITSVKSVVGEGEDAEEQSYSPNYYDVYQIEVKDGMVITVTSGVISRDYTAMVYVDDISAATYSLDLERGDHSYIELNSGYNTINFYDGDNPFKLSFYGAEYGNVYVNGEIVSADYSGGTSYTLNLADGDVVKLYMASNPEKYDVTFDVNGVDNESIEVTCDRITSVSSWSAGFEALPGTEVSIAISGTDNPEFMVNDNAVAAGDDGKYVFTVTGDTNVAITSETSGIEDVAADKASVSDIYNLQGILVKKNATSEDKDQLPAGIYIINGKKVAKR